MIREHASVFWAYHLSCLGASDSDVIYFSVHMGIQTGFLTVFKLLRFLCYCVSEFVRETGAGQKHILIFSDLKEELPKGYKREFDLDLDGFFVTALNVTKLRSDNRDPEQYQTRLSFWQNRVEKAGGNWRIANDLDREGALDLAE